MNWQNYRFFTICDDGKDSYYHFIWVDGEVFAFISYREIYFSISSKEKRYIQHEKCFFPLSTEHYNYINAKKYWIFLKISNHIYDYNEVSDYLKKLMKRELSLEKILNNL